VLLSGRYWLVERVERSAGMRNRRDTGSRCAIPTDIRSLVRFGGSERTRPRRRPTHHTRERRTISWTVIEQRLARDDGASRFSNRSPSAIREIESLPITRSSMR